MEKHDMINKVLNRYRPELEEIKQNMNRAFHLISVNEDLDKILTGIINNPGKMLRPLLMLLIAGKCNADENKELLATAASMEMIHNSSLVLDDMLDEALIRRGEPTVFARYGNSVALCAGEFILASSGRFLQELAYHESVLEVLDITQKACNGEMIQNINRGNIYVTEKDYLEAIDGKTAALYSILCKSACRITHRDDRTKAHMAELGKIIGIVFQMRDDLMDWTACEQDVGKPVNADFSKGVFTLPAIYTFRDPDNGDKLRDLAKKDILQPDDLVEARKLVSESGGIEYTVNYIEKLIKRGRELLDSLPDRANRLEMEEILLFLENR